MKVLHIPAYQDAYQQSLLMHLKKVGVNTIYGSVVQYFSIIEVSLLYNLFKHRDTSIIHLHWQHPFLLGQSRVGTVVKSSLFILQMAMLKLFGIKFVWTIHNLKHHENNFQKLEMFFCRFIAALSNKIIVHCGSIIDDVVKTYSVSREKLTIIPHGNFIEHFKNNMSREEARKQLGFEETDFIFLFLGMIRPYKGIVELLAAFENLNDSSVKLLVAGKIVDEELKHFIEETTDRITGIKLILGYIKDDDIQIYMNAADVLMLPYRDILNSGGAFTGLSFSKPMVAPRLGCIPEVLDVHFNYLYNADQSDGLLNAMRAAVASENKLLERGRGNYKIAKQYDWEAIALSTKALYNSVV